LDNSILKKINKQTVMEGLRSPWSQDEMEGTFSTEYSRLDLHHHQIINEFDELLASLNVSVVMLFRTINKPKKRLVNLKEYKQKRLAINEYENALKTLDQVKELKSQAMDRWIKFLKDNEDSVYRPRQGKFKF
jgi:hypothetical protein